MVPSTSVLPSYRVPIWIAKHLPGHVKSWIHHVRFLERVVMSTYGRMLDGNVIPIKAGPMKGYKLVLSQHTSHAHINGTYEREVQEAIAGMLEPGDVCYDVGASIGYLTLLMARRTNYVYAFEPAPHAIGEMKRHLAANDVMNVTIVAAPVSGDVREVRFCVTDGAYGSAINETETRWPVLQLKTTTLDRFIENHELPDFIKMDIEGEEGSALEGATRLLEKRKPRMCIEVHNKKAARRVLAVLHRFGYAVTMLDGCVAKVPDSVVAGEFHVLARP